MLINVIVIKHVTETNFITRRSAMRYTGINIILRPNIRKNSEENLKLCLYLTLSLVPEFCGFDYFHLYKISQKWLKIATIAKFNTFKVFSVQNTPALSAK